MASVDIDVDGDTVLQTVEYDSTIVYQAGDKKIPKETCAYKVSRAVLTQHSKVFERMLAVPWHDSSQPVIEVEDSVEYMEVILRVLHKTSPIPRMDTKDLWLLVDHLDYYNLDIQLFESYVQNCSKILITYSLLCAREWVFLTWRFNAAKVFAKLTKIMAYSNVGHIQEKNPTELYHLHLPPRIIQQLNAAKGRLRVILHHGLFEVNEKLLAANCKCRKETLFDYEKHLFDIRVWPMEKMAAKKSIDDLIDRLDKDFDYHAKDSACASCRMDFCSHVENVADRVRRYFDGLCLDCLDRSKPKTGDRDNDYWHHNDLRDEKWDHRCRIKHGEPTWYFSYMGRKEDMDRFQKENGRRGNRDFESLLGETLRM